MEDALSTDRSADLRQQLLLAAARGLIVARVAEEARALGAEEEDDGRVKKISALVIALTRIWEMEDRYDASGSSGDGKSDAGARELKALRRDMAKLFDLSDAELAAELERRKIRATGESQAHRRDVSGDRAGAVE